MITEDRLLGGKVILRQPTEGYRAAIDPVLVAAAAPVRTGERVLDLGCGTGAAALCLAARVPGCTIIGIDVDSESVELARANALASGLANVRFERADIARGWPASGLAAFRHVITNPPYGEAGRGNPPASAAKQRANWGAAVDLSAWLEFALAALEPKGRLTLIFRADRLDGLLALLSGRAGETTILPLWPKEGRPAKRVIVSTRKGVRSPACLTAGMTLHRADGRYTAAAEKVLRAGAAIDLRARRG